MQIQDVRSKPIHAIRTEGLYGIEPTCIYKLSYLSKHGSSTRGAWARCCLPGCIMWPQATFV